LEKKKEKEKEKEKKKKIFRKRKSHRLGKTRIRKQIRRKRIMGLKMDRYRQADLNLKISWAFI
jgi:hypothetical protein